MINDEEPMVQYRSTTLPPTAAVNLLIDGYFFWMLHIKRKWSSRVKFLILSFHNVLKT